MRLFLFQFYPTDLQMDHTDDSSSNSEKLQRQDDENPRSSGDSQATDESIIRKVFNLISFRKPGTKEDLDQEIQDLLEEGEEHGLISSLEEKMINSILEFHETFASEIMTPAAEIVSCEIALPIAELIGVIIESGFTRIPIYRENADRIVGIVHVKDLLRLCAGNEEQAGVEQILRPVNFAPESKPIVELLREFQKSKVHIAIIHDEFGAVRGLVTLEDILEEIVGEIDDEYDEDEDAPTFEIQDDGSVAVHGWVDIEKLEDYFGVEFPEGPYESVGGLIVQLLGRLASVGDTLDICGLRFEVLIASERRIDRILVRRIDADGSEESQTTL